MSSASSDGGATQRGPLLPRADLANHSPEEDNEEDNRSNSDKHDHASVNLKASSSSVARRTYKKPPQPPPRHKKQHLPVKSSGYGTSRGPSTPGVERRPPSPANSVASAGSVRSFGASACRLRHGDGTPAGCVPGSSHHAAARLNQFKSKGKMLVSGPAAPSPRSAKHDKRSSYPHRSGRSVIAVTKSGHDKRLSARNTRRSSTSSPAVTSCHSRNSATERVKINSRVVQPPPLPPPSSPTTTRSANSRGSHEYKDYSQVDAEDPTPVKEARRLSSLFHNRAAVPLPVMMELGPCSPLARSSGNHSTPTAAAAASSSPSALHLFQQLPENSQSTDATNTAILREDNTDPHRSDITQLSARLFSRSSGIDTPNLTRLLQPKHLASDTKQWELRKRLDKKEEELTMVRTALGELAEVKDEFVEGAASVERGLRVKIAEVLRLLQTSTQEKDWLDSRLKEEKGEAARQHERFQLLERESASYKTKYEVLAAELDGAKQENGTLQQAKTEHAIRLALVETRLEEAARRKEAAEAELAQAEIAQREAVTAAETQAADEFGEELTRAKEQHATLKHEVTVRRAREEDLCRVMNVDVAAVEMAAPGADGSAYVRTEDALLKAVKRRWEEHRADADLQEELARDLESCGVEIERVKADHQATLEILATKNHDMSELTKSIGDIQRFNRDREQDVVTQRMSAEERAAASEVQVASLGYEKKSLEEALDGARAACASHEGTIATLQRDASCVTAENERLQNESCAWRARDEEICQLLNVDATKCEEDAEGDTEDPILSSLKCRLKEFWDERKMMEELARELEICSGELARLKADHQAAIETLATKDRDMSQLTKSIGDIQCTNQEREQQSSTQRTAVEDRAAAAEAKAAECVQKLLSLGYEKKSLEEAASSSREVCSAHESTIATLQNEIASSKKDIATNESLLARAEEKESEEHVERLALSAQLNAHLQERADSEKQMRDLVETTERTLKDQLRLQQEDLTEKDAEIVRMGETITSLEAHQRSLKESLSQHVEDASNEEEIGRLRGQVANLEARLGAEGVKLRNAGAARQERVRELEEAVRLGRAERKRLHNTIQELRGNVRVFARIRPFLPDDGKHGDENGAPSVSHEGDDTVILTKPNDRGQKHRFSFDHVFGPSTGQEAVFDEVSEFVQSSLDGYNVTLFSYGQTGSGKTFTMQGAGAGIMRGLIPRSIQQIGAHKSQLTTDGWSFNMDVSFLEIYNECLRDLLRADDTCEEEQRHEIKVGSDGRRTVTNLTVKSIDPNDCDAIGAVLTLAAKRRSTAATDMNAESSRSHSVFTLRMTARHEGRNQAVRGTLNLVDLAGSERLDRSNVEGQQAKETVAINKSLSSLTDVFTAIGQKQKHVPFRHSRLTYLLQPSLSGDGKTLMVVNVSPTEKSVQESLCSLRFASRVNKCELGKAKRTVEEVKHGQTGVGANNKRNGTAKASMRYVKQKM